MDKVKLSTDPNLLHKCKSREAAAIIGSIIDGLTNFISVDDVRTAVRWWAETDEAWEFIAAHQATHNIDMHTLQVVPRPEKGD